MVSMPSSLWYCLATKQNCSLASQLLRVSLEERSPAPEGPSLPFQVALGDACEPCCSWSDQPEVVGSLSTGTALVTVPQQSRESLHIEFFGQSLCCKPQSRLCLGPLHRNVPRLTLPSMLHMAWLGWLGQHAQFLMDTPTRVWTPHFCLTEKTLPSEVHCTSHNTPLPWQELFLLR